MDAWLWAGVLILAAWAAHWGADQLLTPLKLLRKQWGFKELYALKDNF
jgi:cation:H+ antiporter